MIRLLLTGGPTYHWRLWGEVPPPAGHAGRVGCEHRLQGAPTVDQLPATQ